MLVADRLAERGELHLEAHFVNSMDEIASIHTASDDTTEDEH